MQHSSEKMSTTRSTRWRCSSNGSFQAYRRLSRVFLNLRTEVNCHTKNSFIFPGMKMTTIVHTRYALLKSHVRRDEGKVIMYTLYICIVSTSRPTTAKIICTCRNIIQRLLKNLEKKETMSSISCSCMIVRTADNHCSRKNQISLLHNTKPREDSARVDCTRQANHLVLVLRGNCTHF